MPAGVFSIPAIFVGSVDPERVSGGKTIHMIRVAFWGGVALDAIIACSSGFSQLSLSRSTVFLTLSPPASRKAVKDLCTIPAFHGGVDMFESRLHDLKT